MAAMDGRVILLFGEVAHAPVGDHGGHMHARSTD